MNHRSYVGAIGVLALLFTGCATPAPDTRTASLRPVCDSAIVERRERAFERGLVWLEEYFADDAHLQEVGEDTVEMFLEFAMSASTEALRERCLSSARRSASRLLPRYLAVDAFAEQRVLEDALALAARADELALPFDALMSRLAEYSASHPDPRALYGVSTNDVHAIPDDDLMMFVVNAYFVEKLAITRPAIQFSPQFAAALDRLEEPSFWRVDPRDANRRDELAYIATHVYFALSDYGRLRTRPTDAPQALAFIQRWFPHALRANDIELMAEFTDVLRSTGATELDDDRVCEVTQRLLGTQREDGSWPAVGEEPVIASAPPAATASTASTAPTAPTAPTAYDTTHPTWTALSALRTRVFNANTAYEERRAQILANARTRAAR